MLMQKVQVNNMALANEGNTNLAFDTVELKACGSKYVEIADKLRTMAGNLDNCLQELEKSGWTTPAGTVFHEMAKTNWGENINKYADLLDTLNNIMQEAVTKYENLTVDYIENTKL